MRSVSVRILAVIGSFCVVGLVGCGDDGTDVQDDETGRLTVTGSGQPPGSVPLSPGANPTGFERMSPVGDPATWFVGMFSFHISMNADCSGPFVEAFSSGSSARRVDLMTGPTFFDADDIPIGTYACVAMSISDILSYTSSVDAGGCSTGVTYEGDVYRAGGEDLPYRDLNLGVIPATGTDAAPSEDEIFIFFTTNRSAAIARGLAPNQTVPLTRPLVVPDAVTFFWDATDAIVDDGDRCLLEPDAAGLFF